MAKNNPPPSGKSRVRIFYVDADLNAGEIRDLTAAFVNAVRQTPQIDPARTRKRLGTGSVADTNGDAQDAEFEVEELEESLPDNDDLEAPTPRAPSKPRKYKSPKVVNDLDMNAGGKSFEEFAQEKGNPEDHTKRYLVAAAWLKKFAEVPTVSVDHIYTCYASAGWTFDIQDPGLPFRHLKKKYGDTKGGKFTINHIGEAKVEKMKSSGEQV